MNSSYSKKRHIQEANERLEKRFLNEQKSVEEQTVAGTVGNVGEIGVHLVKNLLNLFPGSRVRQLKRAAKRAAETGSTTDFDSLLNQVSDNRKEEFKKLKNSLTKGDVAKNFKNLANKLDKVTRPITDPFRKGMGNQQSQKNQQVQSTQGTTTKPSGSVDDSGF